MDVRICGPNLNDQSKGTFHVHADGCPDLRKYGPQYRGADAKGGDINGNREMLVTNASVRAVVMETYADQIREEIENRLSGMSGYSDADVKKLTDEVVDSYASDFHFAACCKELPYTHELTPQQQLVQFLDGTVSTHTVKEHELYSALTDLLYTRNELLKLMSSIERTFEQATCYLNGQPGRFNPLGILQSDGPRVDVLTATFHLQVQAVMKLLRG